jgi:hypothetical protein
MYTGLWLNRTNCLIIKIEPDKSPAAPRPEMARPIIKAKELGAMAHMNDPTWKMQRAVKYTHLMLCKWYNFPYISCTEQFASK